MFKQIEKTKPFVRTKSFQDKTKLDIVKLDVVAMLLPVIATYFVYLVLNIQLVWWNRLEMQGMLFRPIDKLHIVLFSYEIFLLIIFNGWYACLVVPLIYEINDWSGELIESAKLSLFILKDLDSGLADQTSKKRFEYHKIVEQSKFVPYFDTMLDEKSLQMSRLYYIKNMTKLEKNYTIVRNTIDVSNLRQLWIICSLSRLRLSRVRKFNQN